MNKNPWHETVVNRCRMILRFILWICVFLDVVMLAVFSMLFTYRLLTHTWSWCSRVMFPGQW